MAESAPKTVTMSLREILNHGKQLFEAKQYQDAQHIFKQLLAQTPNNSAALHFMAVIAHKLGDKTHYKAWFDKAIQADGHNANLHCNYGVALVDFGDNENAIQQYKRSIEIKADHKVYCNLGAIYQKQHHTDLARAAFEQALVIKTDYANALVNLGLVALYEGNIEQSIDYYRQAIRIEPRNALAHWNLAFTLLVTDNYTEGWQEYAWRWLVEEHCKNMPKFDAPLWDGCDASGKTILVHSEQGFGDALQFFRYLDIAEQKNATIIFQCSKTLKALFKHSKPDRQIYALGETLPKFDLRVPLLSLPGLFNTTLSNIPTKIPYLFPEESYIEKWRLQLNALKKPKIAVTWFGNPLQANDEYRSCALSIFSKLFELNTLQFIVIQKKCTDEEIALLKTYNNVSMVDISNFNDSAALLTQVDLMISVCTAPLHLAGGLGIPAWGLLNFFADWRWGLEREDCPWYPNMRLFRQKKLGEWSEVIDKVKLALQEKFE